jgi:hypothetical protein
MVHVSITNRSVSRWFILLTVLFLSFSTLYLAWPRLQGAYRFIPVDIAIRRYYQTSEIPTERLPVLVRFSQEAIELHDHYRFHNRLSVLHWLRAIDPLTPALERRGEYVAAESEARIALTTNPADPHAWSRLATIRWILHEEPEDIIRPWKMSIFTGRITAPLISSRVELGLAFFDQLDDEAIHMLRDQLLLGWRMQAGSLVKVIAARDRSLQKTRSLIDRIDPEAMAELEEWIERIP